jgi:non-ribosomal peptide synthetase component F/acyl carrier protein
MTQARLIYDREMQEARRYWTARLPSISFAPFIPLDHPRPGPGSDDSERSSEALTFALDAELYTYLRKLTSGNASLMFAALVLGLRLCGAKYSGLSEATIFVPTTGGAGADLTPIVGALPGETTVRDALLATRDLLTAAQRHQRYGLSHLRRLLPNDGQAERLPLVVAMSGLQQELPDQAGDIAMLFEADEAACAVTIRFDRRIYEPGTIQGLFETFSVLLRQALAGMLLPVAVLRADGGRAASPQAPSAFGEGREDAHRRVHQAIEAAARDAPERPAVLEGGDITDFGALVGDVDRLVEILIGLKLDPRHPVAILIDGGLQAIVAMLAVSKAGGAFALIRPSSLRRPLAEALTALGCACLVGGPEQLEDLAASGAPVRITHRIALTRSTARGDAAPRVEVAIVASAVDAGEPPASMFDLPVDTACVLVDDRAERLAIATLGHGELLHLFGWLNQARGVGPNDRALMLPGVGACETLYSAFGLLMAGGSVEIAAASSLDQTAAISEQIAAPDITVWVLTAPLLQNLLSVLPEPRALKAPGPRQILVTGQSQSAAFASRLLERFPAAQVTGLWAEAAPGLWSLYFPYSEPDQTFHRDPKGGAIARTIPGFDHAVLNAAGDLVPLNVSGELHVRRKGEREADWRATGLRARPLGDGSWGWLRGRDHSVLKGDCQVELTRLETVLGRVDGVRMAYVVAGAEGRRGPSVFAFVAGPPESLKAEKVRDSLVGSGDADLVPDRIVTLDIFPLGPDGEIDSAALLASDLSLGAEPAGTDVLFEEIRARLRPLWLRTLQQDEVGDDDSFFGSGGNSLKATLLITRIKDEFGVAIPVQDFFRKPTIHAIVQLIRAGQDAQTDGDVIHDLKPVPRDRHRMLLSDLEGQTETA